MIAKLILVTGAVALPGAVSLKRFLGTLTRVDVEDLSNFDVDLLESRLIYIRKQNIKEDKLTIVSYISRRAPASNHMLALADVVFKAQQAPGGNIDLICIKDRWDLFPINITLRNW